MNRVDQLLRAGRFDDARALILKMDRTAIARTIRKLERHRSMSDLFEAAKRDGLIVPTARLAVDP